MKNLILFLILIPALCFGDMNPYVAGIPADGGDLNFYETFETSTTPFTDETWTTTDGTPNYNFDATTIGMTGSYCMELADTGGSENVTYDIDSPSDEEWHTYQIRLTDGHPVADLYWIYGFNGTTQPFVSRIMTDGRIRFQVTGSATSGVYLNDSGGSVVYLDDGDTGVFYLKIRYKKGTGLNDQLEVWYSTTGTWGNSGMSSTDGTSAVQIDEIKIYNMQADVLTLYLDEVKESDSDIGGY